MNLGAQLIEGNAFKPMIEKYDGEPFEKCLNRVCLVDLGGVDFLINRLDPNADNSTIVWAMPIIEIKKDIKY